MLDHKLHRRSLLRWIGLTGAAVTLPGVSLPPPRKLRAIQESDLPALTAVNPILYTDDDDVLVELARLIFKRQGWTMIDTLYAQPALEICRTQPISLVISDIMKPEMSGVALLEELRADPITRDIPFIFLTCCGFWEDRAEEWGANGFMVKPVRPEEFAQAVRGYLLQYGRWNRAALAKL